MTTPDNFCPEIDVDDVREELIGRKIVAVNRDGHSTITLDNGTVLKFDDYSECSAWFTAEIMEGNLVDNAITRVDGAELPNGASMQAFAIHVFAANEKVCAIEIDGENETGYYCSSVNMHVRYPWNN